MVANVISGVLIAHRFCCRKLLQLTNPDLKDLPPVAAGAVDVTWRVAFAGLVDVLIAMAMMMVARIGLIRPSC